MNHLHESAPWMVYKDYISSYGDLLKTYICVRCVTIHHRNIQSLAMPLFKVK